MKKEIQSTNGQVLDLGIIKSINLPVVPGNFCGGPGCNQQQKSVETIDS